MKTKLVVVGGRATKQEVVLQLPARIGRHRDAELMVVHPTVSRNHCELVERDGHVVLRDLGSTNGTFVAEERVTEKVLEPGGRFTIGPLTFAAEYELVNGAASKLPASDRRLDVASAQASASPGAAETLVAPIDHDHLSLADDEELGLAAVDSAVEIEPLAGGASDSEDLQFDWDADVQPIDGQATDADSAELSLNDVVAGDEAALEDLSIAAESDFELALEPDVEPVAADDEELGFAIAGGDEELPPAAEPAESPAAPPDELSLELADDSSREISTNSLLGSELSPAVAEEQAGVPADDLAALGEEDAFGWELTPAAVDEPESPIAASPELPREAESDLPPLVSDDEDLRFLLDDPASVPPLAREPDLAELTGIDDELSFETEAGPVPAAAADEFAIAFEPESPSQPTVDDSHEVAALELEPLELEIAEQPEADAELSLESLARAADQASEPVEFAIEDDDLAPLAEIRETPDELPPIEIAEDAESPTSGSLPPLDDPDEDLVLDFDIEEGDLPLTDGADLELADASSADSPPPLSPDELALDAAELEGLALDEPEPKPEPDGPILHQGPLPTGPVAPWELSIAEPIVTDAARQLDPLPPISDSQLAGLAFDEPPQPLAAAAAESASAESPPPEGIAAENDDDEFFLDLELAEASPSPAEASAGEPVAFELEEESAELDLGDAPSELDFGADSASADAWVDDPLTAEPRLSEPGDELNLGESELDLSASAESAAPPEPAAKKSKRGWWPFGRGKKKESPQAAAEPESSVASPSSAEPGAGDAAPAVDDELFAEFESDLPALEPSAPGGLDDLELAADVEVPDDIPGPVQDAAAEPQPVEGFDLEDELARDGGAVPPADAAAPSDELSFDEISFDEPAATTAEPPEFEAFAADDPLADLEEKESQLLAEGSDAELDLPLALEPQAGLELDATTEFVPSD
ncbi:MAG: FHA domain-containing protein, partial [Planctomycetaceae bacterium]|nr:FHA domain-containing protein [Planctomycetaceae bacterium]